MKMLHLALILLSLSDVLTQDSDWGVKYADNQICAVRGFNVSIPCSYYYPTSNPIQLLLSNIKTVTDVESFLLSDKDLKVSLIRLSGNGPFKYGDSLNLMCDVTCTQSSSQFVWSKNNELLPESGPILHFPALTLRDSGNYTCTWKTNTTSGSKTISLQVEVTDVESFLLSDKDLKVSLIRLSGNGTFKPGDSLNLTCDVTCTQSSSQFVWSKNNELLPESGAVLHFPALTLRDSGNYTCTWKTSTTSESKTISLQVESVIYYRRRKLKAPEENKSGEKTQKKQQFNRVSDEEIVNTEEVTYASVQINKATTKSLHINFCLS
ncbi:hypothetical protein C0J45_18109 [Silurus meridionalis]|nr:hypothetical protein C0J45_18109 [Silurus meridionalis]